MNRNNNPAPKLTDTRNQTSNWSSDAGLSVTVISTTDNGTIAALKAARSLATDLDAAITLLNMEIVPARFPLYRSRVSLKYTINQQRSLVRKAGAIEADVDLKIRLCRDWNSGLQRILHRRSLVVIGGKRHWWVSREERLERVLRGLGHHIIFIDVVQEENRTSQSNYFPLSFGRNGNHLHNRERTAKVIVGARTRKKSGS
jgi:hypothetical protein